MGENSYASVTRGGLQPMKTTNIALSRRSWKRMIGQSFRSIWKNYTWPNFTKHQLSNRLGIGRDSMLSSKQKHTKDLPLQQELLLKVENLYQNSRYISNQSDYQKALNVSPLRQLKQKSKAPVSEAGKIRMNTKERPGSTFKIPSRKKSPIRLKQCNAQGSTKPLQRTYSIKSMDCDTDNIVASLNLEEIINNYKT